MVKFPEIGAIEDVNRSVYVYIKKHWGWKFFAPAFLLILGSCATLYFGGSNYLRIAVLPFLAIIAGIAIAQSMVREEFMRQFAARNNFTYIGDGDVKSVLGSLFQRGHSQEITCMVAGAIDGYEIRFFTFYYTVGSGKNKTTYDYAVCEVKTKGNAPDIIVESKDDWDFQNYADESKREIPTEPAFQEHFSVFVPKNFEIETLEIFTPDVFEELLKRARKYNFEFIDDKLYVFRSGEIGKRAELEEFLKLIDYIVDNIVPKILSVSGDVSALEEARKRNEAR